MRKEKSIALAALVTAFVAMAGCQSQPAQTPPPAPAGPMHEGYTRPRNPYFLPKPILAMESDGTRELAAKAGEVPGQRELAWYDARNDARVSVQSGYQTATLETVYTQTWDRQYQHGGTVRDHYNRWSRQGSVKEVVR